MNQLPPNAGPPDDIDDRYRRAAALDPSRPSESVRRAVLEHAAKLAAERSMGRSAAQEAEDIPTQLGVGRTAANQRWWRPAIFGTLAAAALAGILIGPQYLPPHAPSTVAQSKIEATRPEADAVQSLPVSQSQPPSSPLMAQRQGMAKDRAASGNAAALKESAQDKASSYTAPPENVSPMGASAEAPAAALRRAAESGDIGNLQILLHQRLDVDARDVGGRTALMLATLHGQIRAVDALLSAGADPNAADAGGVTPLGAAMHANQSAIAAALRRAGAR